MQNKKILLVLLIVVVVAGLGAGGYYYLKMNAKPIIWDGTYQMSGNLNCTGNYPNLTTIPMTSDVTVIGNKVVDQVAGNTMTFAIDKKGVAKEVMPEMTSNGITISGDVDYQFYQEDGANKFTANGSMTMSVVQSGVTYSSVCAGTILGVKK
ncbi:MAG: hypothetical protein PHF44_02535 [Candidatus Pacebacteria bacterium]|nr:hypothetical protein [Candidatus Paceibacterota bacterium]